ncbi:MAG: hypothetical protein K8I30_05030 [Anaerolineae bacterium]|nr:hypothetical protein [Anaerolineae bacterium]
MNQRDRLLTTAIIWVVFIFLALLVFDRVLIIPLDFKGLWPEQTSVYTYPLTQDIEQLTQIMSAARDATPALLAQAQADIQMQLAQRVPIVAAVSAMLMFAAAFSTYFIWRNAGLEAYLAREVVQAEKTKRRSRIEQFIDDLDSDEITQLRTRLSDDKGASTSTSS